MNSSTRLSRKFAFAAWESDVVHTAGIQGNTALCRGLQGGLQLICHLLHG